MGVLSDSHIPMKQIVDGGTSIITSDFEQQMGKLATDLVKKKQ